MLLRPVYIYVDLEAIIHNVKLIKSILNPQTKLMAVVKANAYGHGAIEVSRAVLFNGVDYLGVACLDEAIELRNNGIDAPILILGYTPDAQAEYVVKYDLTQSVYTLELACALSNSALKLNKKAKVHVKIDTGMNRLGIPYQDSYGFFKKLIDVSNIDIEGIFTHMSSADEVDKTYTKLQFRRFRDVMKVVSDAGLDIQLRHVANTATIIDLPDMQLDMVRLGIGMYGLWPSEFVNKSIDLKEAMELKSEVAYVKDVPKGSPISYGRIHTTDEDSKIATVPLGYADGFLRLLSNKAEVLVHDRRAKVVGRVCMDQFMIDVTHIPDVHIGDEVVIFGGQGNERISIDEVAGKMNTINYEVVCLIGKRSQIVYKPPKT